MAQGDGAQRYYMSEQNPNDAQGGGGCACGERRCADRGGPYAVFYATETDSNISPHVVLCAPCAKGVFRDLDGEIGVAGTAIPDPVEAVEHERPEPHENPVSEGVYPDLDALDDELAI